MIGLDLSEIAHYYLHHAKILSARCDTVFHIWCSAIDRCVCEGDCIKRRLILGQWSTGVRSAA